MMDKYTLKPLCTHFGGSLLCLWGVLLLLAFICSPVCFLSFAFAFPCQRLLFVYLYSSCAFSIFSGSLLVSLSCISSSTSHAWSVSRTIWSADQKQFSSYSFTLNPFVPSQVCEGHILSKQQRSLKWWCFFFPLQQFWTFIVLYSCVY